MDMINAAKDAVSNLVEDVKEAVTGHAEEVPVVDDAAVEAAEEVAEEAEAEATEEA